MGQIESQEGLESAVNGGDEEEIGEAALDEIVHQAFAAPEDSSRSQRKQPGKSTVRITIPAAAAEQLKAFAANRDVTLKTYLEAVLHYVISTERRPGSWEGSQPFEFRTYDTRREGGSFADRWF